MNYLETGNIVNSVIFPQLLCPQHSLPDLRDP